MRPTAGGASEAICTTRVRRVVIRLSRRDLNAIVVALVLGALAACGGSAPTSSVGTSSDSGSDVPRPPRDLYEPPDPLRAAQPGTLIWAEDASISELTPPSRIYRILYHSTGATGTDVAVSGFAIIPDTPATRPRAVYAWGHGTAGLGDQCAPSHDIKEHLPPYGGLLLERGAVIVATDYEGLGTPGVPTQADGQAEGRALLDSVRAIASLPGVGEIGEVMLAGHSQGGPAALFAGQLAASYAPELSIAGVVALAPGAELPTLVDALAESPAKGLALVGAAGIRAAHPNLELGTVLTPKAIAELDEVEHDCVDDVLDRYADTPTDELFVVIPSSDASLRTMLEANSPGGDSIAAPVFLAHGDVDEQVPPVISERLRTAYCDLEVNVTRHTYADTDHDGVIDAAADDVLAFIEAVLDHKDIADGC